MRSRKTLPWWASKPPVNRAQAALRVVLWLLPSGFVAFSAIAPDFIPGRVTYLGKGFAVWLVLNLIFILGAGWYNATLSTRARGELHGIANRTVLFFVIQLFLVPFLLTLLLYLALATGFISF